MQGKSYEWEWIKDYDKAEENYSKVIDLDKNNKQAYFNRAQIRLLYLKNCEGAISDINEESELSSVGWNSTKFSGLGLVYLDCYKPSKLEKAIYYLNKSIDDEHDSYVFAKLGEAYLQKNDYENALKNFNHALELDKRIWDAVYSYRGSIYQKQKKYVDSLIDLNNAIKLKGVNYENVKKEFEQIYKEAIIYYTKKIERESNKSISYFDRGRIHKIYSEKEKAKVDFEQCLKLSTDFLLIEKVQKEIDELF